MIISLVKGRTEGSHCKIQHTNSNTNLSSGEGLLERGIGDKTRKDVHSTTRIDEPWNSHSNGEWPNHHAKSRQPMPQTSVLFNSKKSKDQKWDIQTSATIKPGIQFTAVGRMIKLRGSIWGSTILRSLICYVQSLEKEKQQLLDNELKWHDSATNLFSISNCHVSETHWSKISKQRRSIITN